MPRTSIPQAGGNRKVAEHNLYDFRALIPASTGNIFFVDSAQTSGSGLSPEDPVSTIDAAINLCTASNGDIIVVMEGHSETISTAGAIAMDVVGVSIIGLGHGASVPLVTFSETDATWDISAADCLVKNIRVTSSVNELVTMFSVTAANVTIDAVNYVDPGAALETLQFLLTTNAADYLTIKNCHHVASTAGASAQKWISLIGVEAPRILDCTFILALFDHATTATISGDASVRRAEIGRVRCHQTGYSSAIVSVFLIASGGTGMTYDCRLYADTAALTTINDCPTFAHFESYVSNDLDKNGIIDPTVAS
jgi:hypothetical protein